MDVHGKMSKQTFYNNECDDTLPNAKIWLSVHLTTVNMVKCAPPKFMTYCSKLLSIKIVRSKRK